MRELRGLGVSPGQAVGRVLKVDTGLPPVQRRRLPDQADLTAELQRFETAVQETNRQLGRFEATLERQLGRDHSLMVQAHILILNDVNYSGSIRELIRTERVNAEWAVTVVNERIQEVYRQLEDPYLQDKNHDIQDLTTRLLANLAGLEVEAEVGEREAVILVSDELTMSLLSRLDLQQLKGFAVDQGGWTSHTSILAKALGIPSVIHLGQVCAAARTGDHILIDGDSGRVWIDPDGEALNRFRDSLAAVPRAAGPFCFHLSGAEGRSEGVAGLRLYVNAEFPQELDHLPKLGVAGVGLFRSDYLFLPQPVEEIDAAEHTAVYTQLARAAHPNPVNLRTFDLGLDDLAIPLHRARETNPALGLRGVRLGLQRLEMFRRQLEGILRANAATGNLRVTFPFISSLDEVRLCRQILDSLRAELPADFPPLPVGIMLEVPSTIFVIEELCAEVDFFTLGTNDLVQFILARDRGGAGASSPLWSAHPAVRRALGRIREATARAGREVICCGEMAAHPHLLLVLLGLGFRSLSVAPPLLPLVRHIAHHADEAALASFTRALDALPTMTEVERFFAYRLGDHFPAELVHNLTEATRQPSGAPPPSL